MIRKLLIANRGEIACRVIRTAKQLGIQTVAIYSDIDKFSKHTTMADQSFHVGQNPSSQSYLQTQKIIDIAKNSNCQAIHPGFGFLSENAEFADQCEQNKLIFVGPSSNAMRKMGSKIESKKIMEKANVPVVPGYWGEDQNIHTLMSQAEKIGFPIMIKAALGGGGKGIRISFSAQDFFAKLEAAKREAMKSFKDEQIFIEKYITKPRHIEIQVFGDVFKNYVYLFERDCSIQRRHQKVVEEAPSIITPQLRQLIGETAIQAARAVDYHNAGTIEFIFDTETNKYFFMEMNTRLQVEHPITEMITGQDLVEWQLIVANGLKLPMQQKDLKINGHAIESRLYSEDPFNGFLPANGQLKYFQEPLEIKNEVRIESGVREKDHISIFYDPMIAKLIVWGKERNQAINRMHDALLQYKTELLKKQTSMPTIDLLAGILIRLAYQNKQAIANNVPESLLNFRVNHDLHQFFKFNVEGSHIDSESMPTFKAEVFFLANGRFDINLYSVIKENEVTLLHEYKNVKSGINESNPRFIDIDINDITYQRQHYVEKDQFYSFDEEGETIQFVFANDKMPEIITHEHGEMRNKIKSPMPGTIFRLQVQVGQEILKGHQVLILEAMKMEHSIKAIRDGKVSKILFKEGEFVESGQVLIEFEDNQKPSK